jgi:hypothetical protein
MIVAKDKEAEWRKPNNLVEEYIATVVGPLPAEVAADIEPTPVIDHRWRHHRRRCCVSRPLGGGL